MDENTQMMIKLASMMMQNESAIRETQKELSSAPRPVDLSDDTDRNSGTEVSPKQKTEVNGVTTSLDTINQNGDDTIKPNVTSGKKVASEKPVTIAQIFQSQNVQPVSLNAQGSALEAMDTSEGKIFVYNTFSEQDIEKAIKKEVDLAKHGAPGKISGRLSLPEVHRTGSGRGSVTPIRNKYGRVLRPGIDNFGRFEAVANPGLIMHAMELMRHKDKKKRGPKEKETFSVFMYCLPDKNSKLPKFSSLDPIERALVDQHQQEGYGYPSQDYINGIPRKTQLCLTYSEAQFQTFMTELYPKLEGRLYDMYRIDKTRRLIQVEVKSPRQLKDMKYQGSVIIIPYDTPEEKPAPIIHRNFDEVYNGGVGSVTSLSSPLSLMQAFNITIPSLPEMVHEPKETRTDQTHYTSPTKPKSISPFPKVPTTKNVSDLLIAKAMMTNGTATNSDLLDGHNERSVIKTGPFASVPILQKAFKLRSKLLATKRVHVKPESLLTDLIGVYRADDTLEQHKLAVCYQIHAYPEDANAHHDDDVDVGSVLVMFWDEMFRRHFSGNQDMVPVVDPSVDDDMFKICGRILVHGIILENYLPLKFSPACLTTTVTGNCSDRLILTSLYRVMSESEKEVLESCMEEVRLRLEIFTPGTENNLRTILGSYGCRKVPLPYELDSSMAKIARSFLIYQPHWSLQQLLEGIIASGRELFAGITEDTILKLYQVLTPSVPCLLSRVNYIFSDSDDIAESENKVKLQFEQFLYKLPKSALLRLLYQWSGYDCLCLNDLFVKFSGQEENASPLFVQKQAMMSLPSYSASMEELRVVLEGQLPAVGLVDM